jgi:hypothetical protein
MGESQNIKCEMLVSETSIFCSQQLNGALSMIPDRSVLPSDFDSNTMVLRRGCISLMNNTLLYSVQICHASLEIWGDYYSSRRSRCTRRYLPLASIKSFCLSSYIILRLRYQGSNCLERPRLWSCQIDAGLLFRRYTQAIQNAISQANNVSASSFFSSTFVSAL